MSTPQPPHTPARSGFSFTFDKDGQGMRYRAVDCRVSIGPAGTKPDEARQVTFKLVGALLRELKKRFKDMPDYVKALFDECDLRTLKNGNGRAAATVENAVLAKDEATGHRVRIRVRSADGVRSGVTAKGGEILVLGRRMQFTFHLDGGEAGADNVILGVELLRTDPPARTERLRRTDDILTLQRREQSAFRLDERENTAGNAILGVDLLDAERPAAAVVAAGQKRDRPSADVAGTPPRPKRRRQGMRECHDPEVCRLVDMGGSPAHHREATHDVDAFQAGANPFVLFHEYVHLRPRQQH